MGTLRRRWMVILLLAFLEVALASAPGVAPRASAAGGTPASGAAGLLPATQVKVFHPKGTAGAPVKGTCDMGKSVAVLRADAWRCMAGNVIYDPCFSAKAHATSVICGASPDKPVGITITLPQPLPTHAPVHGSQAWILQLGDGTTCTFLTGATFGIKGQRANYGCSDSIRDYVVGMPIQGRVWYAVRAILGTKPSPNGPSAERLYAISVARVWL